MAEIAYNHLPDSFYSMTGATCTMTRKQLRETLLATDGWILAQGRIRNIKSKHIGVGVYQVSLEPIKD